MCIAGATCFDYLITHASQDFSGVTLYPHGTVKSVAMRGTRFPHIPPFILTDSKVQAFTRIGTSPRFCAREVSGLTKKLRSVSLINGDLMNLSGLIKLVLVNILIV